MIKRPDQRNQAPWKQRFRAASISWATVAKLNPERGLVCTDRGGVRQLYAWEVQTGDLRQLTDHPVGVISGMLSADGNWVYYLQDEGGNELGHYVRVPFQGGAAQDITPELPLYGSFAISQSYQGKTLGAWLADPSGQMLYLFDQDLQARQIYKSGDMFNGPSLSYHGEMAVIASTEGTGSLDTKLIAFDTTTGEQVAKFWQGEGVSHELGEFVPLPGDFRLLSTTSESGYPRPIIWNARTGERRDLQLDGVEGTVYPWSWTPDGRQVLLNHIHQAEQQLYLYDLETDRAHRLDHPSGAIGNFLDTGIFTGDEIWITWQDPAHPPRLVALDRSSGVQVRTILAAGDVPAGRPWRSISFTSENGAAIQAWLAVPGGDGPYPTIFHTHGGPTSVMGEGFAPESQAWLDHGYAFFTINYHGSTTFGKDFEKSILGRLGELEVQDMAAGYRWLVENNIAQPDAVFLTGGSYGGYLTLQALGKQPALWAGGMAGVAIADWAVMYEDESEALRGYHRVMFGGTPEETPEAHIKSSPITYAEHIEAPILVIQGSNDTRCPPRQMRAFEAKLQSLGKPIRVHWFDAGHGSRAQEQNIEHMSLKLQFAFEVLQDSA